MNSEGLSLGLYITLVVTILGRAAYLGIQNLPEETKAKLNHKEEVHYLSAQEHQKLQAWTEEHQPLYHLNSAHEMIRTGKNFWNDMDMTEKEILEAK